MRSSLKHDKEEAIGDPPPCRIGCSDFGSTTRYPIIGIKEEGLHNLDDTSVFADTVITLLGAIYVDRHRKAKFIQASILPTLDNDDS